jgi:hypothetical protein
MTSTTRVWVKSKQRGIKIERGTEMILNALSFLLFASIFAFILGSFIGAVILK